MRASQEHPKLNEGSRKLRCDLGVKRERERKGLRDRMAAGERMDGGREKSVMKPK